MCRCCFSPLSVSQTYHDVHYVAEKELVAGEEIFVEYGTFFACDVHFLMACVSLTSSFKIGDNYFAQRDDLAFVPLSNDFKNADRFLKRLASFANNDIVS